MQWKDWTIAALIGLTVVLLVSLLRVRQLAHEQRPRTTLEGIAGLLDAAADAYRAWDQSASRRSEVLDDDFLDSVSDVARGA